MFTNTSNISSLPAQAPPIFGVYYCFLFRFSFTMFLSFSVTNVLTLTPLCVSVWILGVLLRKSPSHSDVFTFHLVAMEMVSISACAVYVRSFWTNDTRAMTAAMRVYSFTSFGQIYFHILTCLDRYVAVVFPIGYLRLKERGGVRNTLIGCAWLLFVLKIVINADFESAVHFFFLSLAVVVVSFCNLAVLYVLVRPPPGERAQVSRSKRRAFNTILLILCVLLFRIVTQLSVVGVFESDLWSKEQRCAALVSGVFFSLPSSLVLPLLFLYRVRVTSYNNNTHVVTATSS